MSDGKSEEYKVVREREREREREKEREREREREREWERLKLGNMYVRGCVCRRCKEQEYREKDHKDHSVRQNGICDNFGRGHRK